MPLNVLLVTYYWPPCGGAGVQRILKFAKYLPRFDIQPIVLTVSNPTYPVFDESLSEEVPDNLPIHKTFSLEPFSLYGRISGKSKQEVAQPTMALKGQKSLTGRLATWIRANLFLPDARLGWIFTAKPKARELINSYGVDAILTSGPPHSVHFIGNFIKKKTGIRWIADFRDPWTHIHYNQVLPRTKLVQKLDLLFESRILSSADEVLVVSPSMESIQKKVVNRTYNIITNGFDPDDFYRSEQLESQHYINKDLLTIRFVGSVREAAIPEGFLKAISQLKDKNKIRIEFVGNIHPYVKRIVKDLDISEQVKFMPYVPHVKAIKYMQTTDLLLLSISQTKNSEQILTGKLFDYLGAKRPILFLGPSHGDAAKIIKEIDQGVCYEHEDVEAIKNHLEAHIQEYFQKGELSNKGANIEEKQKNQENHPYSRIELTRQLSELLKK